MFSKDFRDDNTLRFYDAKIIYNDDTDSELCDWLTRGDIEYIVSTLGNVAKIIEVDSNGKKISTLYEE